LVNKIRKPWFPYDPSFQLYSKLYEGFEKPTGGSKPRSSLDNPRRGLSADDEDR